MISPERYVVSGSILYPCPDISAPVRLHPYFCIITSWHRRLKSQTAPLSFLSTVHVLDHLQLRHVLAGIVNGNISSKRIIL